MSYENGSIDSKNQYCQQVCQNIFMAWKKREKELLREIKDYASSVHHRIQKEEDDLVQSVHKAIKHNMEIECSLMEYSYHGQIQEQSQQRHSHLASVDVNSVTFVPRSFQSADLCFGRIDVVSEERIMPPSGHHVTSSSGHHVTSSSGHHVAASSGHHVTSSSGHHVDASSGHHVAASSGYHVADSSGHHVIPSSGHHVADSSGHHERHDFSSRLKTSTAVQNPHESTVNDARSLQADMLPKKFLLQFSIGDERTVSVYLADLITHRCDAIVNAANKNLCHNGGLAAALSHAAGRELQLASDKLEQERGPLKYGDVVVTEGFKLPCKYVIHAIGPDHRTIASLERCKILLKETFIKVFLAANQYRCRSIAIPAISSGIFQVPFPIVTSMMLEALEYLELEILSSTLRDIQLVNKDKISCSELLQACQDKFKLLPHLLKDYTVTEEAKDMMRQLKDIKKRNYEEEEALQRQEQCARSHPMPAEGAVQGPMGNSFNSSNVELLPAQLAATSLSVQNRMMDKLLPKGCLMKVSLGNGFEVLVCQADMTKYKCDAIVNAANPQLLHSGGLAKALTTAAGPEMQADCAELFRRDGSIPAGHAVSTHGYRLPCRMVIHAVGPDANVTPSLSECQRLLQSTFTRALDIACSYNCRSIAIPGISSGSFGVPLREVAEVLALSIRYYVFSCPAQASVRELHLVNNDDKICAEILRAVGTTFAGQMHDFWVGKAGEELLEKVGMPFQNNLHNTNRAAARSPASGVGQE